jgi:hypothetical protein
VDVWAATRVSKQAVPSQDYAKQIRITMMKAKWMHDDCGGGEDQKYITCQSNFANY